MKFVKRYLCTTLCVLITPHETPSAQAEVSSALKRAVLVDCQQASNTTLLLSDDDKQNFVPYLSRVLQLDARSLGALLPQTGIEGSFGGVSILDVLSPNYSHSFDPSREEEAKRCAVKLLEQLGVVALPTLTDIVKVASDPVTPRDLRESAAATLRVIAQRVSADPVILPDDKLIEKLIDQLSEPTYFYAESALLELSQKSVPGLLRFIRGLDDSSWKATAQVFTDIEAIGGEVVPSLIPLVGNPDEKIRARTIGLLGALTQNPESAYPILISRLNDLSATVQQAARDGISMRLEQSPQTDPAIFDTSLRSELLTTLKRSNKTERELVAAWIRTLIQRGVNFEKEILGLSIDHDEDLQLLLVQLIGTHKEPSNLSFTLIEKSLKSESFILRKAGIEALRAFGKIGSSAIPVLSSFLKRISTLPQGATRQSLHLEAARSIAALQLGAAGAVLVPSMLDTLSIDGESIENSSSSEERPLHPGVLALKSLSPASRDGVEKLLKKSPSRVKAQALLVVSLTAWPSSRQAAVTALNDENEEVRKAALEAVVKLGRETLPEIKKTLSKLSPRGKLTTAEALARLNAYEPKTGTIILEAMQNESCLSRARLANLLPVLTGEEEERAVSLLLDCLGQNSDSDQTILSVINRFAPFSDAAQEKIKLMVLSPSVASQTRLTLLDRSAALGLSDAVFMEVIRLLLERGESSYILPLTRAIQSRGAAVQDLLVPLEQLRKNEDIDPSVRFAAIAAIAQIDPAALPFPDIFLEGLSSSERTVVSQTILRLPLDVALNVLRLAISNLSTKLKPVALECAGKLGSGAAPLADLIAPLLADQHDRLRQSALVAMLRIDPNHPASEAVLRATLTTPSTDALQHEEFPDSTHVLFKRILSTPQNNTEKVNVLRLLGQLKQEPSSL